MTETEHTHTCSPDGNMVDCDACGERDCPWGEPMHYHHDGCPSCDVDGFGSQDAAEVRSSAGPEIKRLRERLQELYEAAGASTHAQLLDMLRCARSGEALRIIAEQRAEIERLKSAVEAPLDHASAIAEVRKVREWVRTRLDVVDDGAERRALVVALACLDDASGYIGNAERARRDR